MSIDLAAAEELFATSTDATVGLEEEFAVLDAASLDLVPRFEELRDLAIADDPVLAEAIAGELISSEIEIRSGRGEDVHDALRRQRDVRNRLFSLAESRGVALGATGTHPWADYREQHNIDTEHYRRVVDGLRYVARRNNTFSLHVHVGRARRRARGPRVRPAAPGAPIAAQHQRQLALPRRARQRAALGALAGLHQELPALRHPRRVRVVEGLPRLHRLPHPHRVDHRVHAGVVVDSPAPLVRDGRGAHLRRADHRAGGRGAQRADRGLRGAGPARHRRGRALHRSAAPAGRGELLARDPLRAGRDAARPRSRRAVPGGRGDRAAAAVDRPGARGAGPRADLPGAQRRPAPAPRDRRAVPACRRSSPPPCARPVRPTSRRPRPHERAAAAEQHSPGSPPRRSCAPPTSSSSSRSASRTCSSRPSSRSSTSAACAPGSCRATRARPTLSSCAGHRGRAGAAAAGRAGPRARRAPDPRRDLAAADGVRAPGRRRRGAGDDGPAGPRAPRSRPSRRRRARSSRPTRTIRGLRRAAEGSGFRGVDAGRTAPPPPSSIGCAPSERVWRPRGRLLPLAHASACRRRAVTRIRSHRRRTSELE